MLGKTFRTQSQEEYDNRCKIIALKFPLFLCQFKHKMNSHILEEKKVEMKLCFCGMKTKINVALVLACKFILPHESANNVKWSVKHQVQIAAWHKHLDD